VRVEHSVTPVHGVNLPPDFGAEPERYQYPAQGVMLHAAVRIVASGVAPLAKQTDITVGVRTAANVKDDVMTGQFRVGCSHIAAETTAKLLQVQALFLLMVIGSHWPAITHYEKPPPRFAVDQCRWLSSRLNKTGSISVPELMPRELLFRVSRSIPGRRRESGTGSYQTYESPLSSFP
jgi:hypothetical protein